MPGHRAARHPISARSHVLRAQGSELSADRRTVRAEGHGGRRVGELLRARELRVAARDVIDLIGRDVERLRRWPRHRGVGGHSASAAGGRAPQFGRNIFVGPGLHNIDLRVLREFSIHERLKVQFLAEAFNLFNETNLNLGGNTATTAFNYVAVGGKGCPGSSYNGFNGCLTPSPTFMAPSSGTSTNTLYGPRQLQFSAKIVF